MPPYFLLVLQTLLKIGHLLVLHEVKVAEQMKQNTQKAKGKRGGKRKDGWKRAALSVPDSPAAGPPWPFHLSVQPLV